MREYCFNVVEYYYNRFPSRMTIGMLLESLAGKGGAIRGNFEEGTPYTFSKELSPISYLGDNCLCILIKRESGEQLRNLGFAYGGSEPVASSVLLCESRS